MSVAEPFVPFFGESGITAPVPGPARPRTEVKPAERSGFVPTLPPNPAPPSPAPPAGNTAPAAAIPASPPAAAVAMSPAKDPHPAHGKPIVTLQREGDKVTRIRVQCGCGEAIDLDCLY